MSYGAIGTQQITGTGGTHDKFNPEIWSKDVQLAVENNLVASKLVKRLDALVKGGGDVFRIPKISNMPSPNARTATTTTILTIDATTEDYVTLNVDKRYTASFMIDDMQKLQSAIMVADFQKEKSTYSLTKQMDSDVLALYSSFTNAAIGTLGTDPSLDDFVAGVMALDTADAPSSDRVLVVGPKTKAAFSKITQFISRDYVDQTPVKSGLLGDRYGVNIYWTNNISTSGGNEVNQMFHRDASVLAVQQDVKLEMDRRIEYTSDLYVASCVYGLVIYRPTFGVSLYGK